jgi:hypothetical protein
MAHHCDPRINPRQRLANLYQYLRCHYGPSIRDRLEIKKSQWTRLLTSQPIDVDVLDYHLSQLGINQLTLQRQHFEPALVVNFLEGQKNYLPSYYRIGAFSSKRIGISLFSIIENNYGKKTKDHILKSLQIGESFFDNTSSHNNVSTLLYSHIYEFLRSQIGVSEKDLYWIGQKTTMTDLNPHWKERYCGYTHAQAYADYLEQISLHVEQSYQYELYCLNKKEVIFRKRPSPLMQELLHSKIYGNHESCVYSLGFTSSVGYYANGLFPLAKKTRCLYQGDSFSEFVVDLTEFSPPSYFPISSYPQ